MSRNDGNYKTFSSNEKDANIRMLQTSKEGSKTQDSQTGKKLGENVNPNNKLISAQDNF